MVGIEPRSSELRGFQIECLLLGPLGHWDFYPALTDKHTHDLNLYY